MAHLTTYTCDRCKMQSTDHKFLEPIHVVVVSSRWPRPPFAAEWCRVCLLAVGLVAPARAETSPVAPPITLEELVRQIATDAAIEVVDNR